MALLKTKVTSLRHAIFMKILAVDDETAILELIELSLKKNGFEVVTAADGHEALAKAAGVDLIVLDVMLPELDGFEVCRRLKLDKATQSIPIIMLTAKLDEIDKVLGLELGADDYMTKPFSPRELVARIKAVLRRTLPSETDQKLTVDELTLDFNSYEAMLSGEVLALTPKEFELLKLLVTNPSKAFSRDELLEKIWGYEYYGDTRTVDVHIRHLRHKLEPAARLSSAIETVRGIGYRFKL